MSSRVAQFQVTLPDGLLIDRLPLGYANDHWHLTFVCSGVDFSAGRPSRAINFPEEFSQRVSISSASGGKFEYAGGGGHGSAQEHDRHLRFRSEGAESVEIRYLWEGRIVAREVLDLLGR